MVSFLDDGEDDLSIVVPAEAVGLLNRSLQSTAELIQSQVNCNYNLLHKSDKTSVALPSCYQVINST